MIKEKQRSFVETLLNAVSLIETGIWLLGPSAVFFFLTKGFPLASRLLAILFFPTMLVLTFLGSIAYFQATLGPSTSPADNGGGIGTAFALLVAIPLIIVANIILYRHLKKRLAPSAQPEPSEKNRR